MKGRLVVVGDSKMTFTGIGRLDANIKELV